jgi:DNA-binding transcriptional MerR regulator
MWTMDELVERVREALAGEYAGAPNGRVRDVPDRRAIRWYTTIGLVDRPLGMRGRTALYGPRHLQQLVAIKRWQAQGRSLAQIQADFTWLTPEALVDASQVPEHLMAAGGHEPDLHSGPARHHFWTDRPAAQPAEATTDLPETDLEMVTAARPAPVPAPVHGVVLDGGVVLLVPHPLSDRDRADIAAAAAPLLDLLETRGLIDGRKP